MIYLDNNATTMPDPAVREAMLPFLSADAYANPSSTHRFGQDSRQAVEQSRRKIAALLGCDAKELIFTSGGTESDNAAIWGLLFARGWLAGSGAAKKAVITSTVEHSAIREPLAALEKMGLEVIRIGVDISGALDLAALAAVLEKRQSDIALASIMCANNETGVIFDIRAAGELCRRHGDPLHVDGVQAIGKIPVSLRDMPIDLLSISGHKFHAAKGTGALFVRRGIRWQPWIRGGPQEHDRRGGTENVAGIVGMGVAADLAAAALVDGQTIARIARLRDRLENGILEKIRDAHVIGDRSPGRRVPNTANIAFASLEAEAILLLLSEQEICASAGAACSSGSLEPSPVLKAMGIDDRIGHGAVRFSLSRFTTEEEIDQTLAALPPIITRLRETLPV